MVSSNSGQISRYKGRFCGSKCNQYTQQKLAARRSTPMKRLQASRRDSWLTWDCFVVLHFSGYPHPYIRCRLYLTMGYWWICNKGSLIDPSTSFKSPGKISTCLNNDTLSIIFEDVTNSRIYTLLQKYRNITTGCSISQPNTMFSTT